METIRLRDGKVGVTRRWERGSNEWKFAALGKKYYKTLRRNYVADIPITIHGKRKNGTTYTMKSHMKMEQLGLTPVQIPLDLTLEQRRALAKRMILSHIRGHNQLYEVSDETWTYDAEGSWRISEETVGVDPDTGAPEAHVVLDRRVRSPQPLVSNALLFPHAICEEAFAIHDDKMRAPRQMAAVLRCDVGGIGSQFTQISLQLYGTEQWEEEGATPRMIIECCKKQGYGCVAARNEEVIETAPGNPIFWPSQHAKTMCTSIEIAQFVKHLRREVAISQLDCRRHRSPVRLQVRLSESLGKAK